MELFRVVLQARAKGVPLGVSVSGHQSSTVGVHHQKYAVHSLTSTSLYTSSLHSTTIIADQYDVPFGLNRVKHHADCFLICFQLEDILSTGFRIEDELFVEVQEMLRTTYKLTQWYKNQGNDRSTA